MKVEDRLRIFLSQSPSFEEGVYVSRSANIVGDVRIGRDSSIWYGSVLRGDINYISIGKSTNLQDGVVGHLADHFPLIVGNFVTVGHGAILHACTIEDECLIGMGATILDGAKLGPSLSLQQERLCQLEWKSLRAPWLLGFPVSLKKL